MVIFGFREALTPSQMPQSHFTYLRIPHLVIFPILSKGIKPCRIQHTWLLLFSRRHLLIHEGLPTHICKVRIFIYWIIIRVSTPRTWPRKEDKSYLQQIYKQSISFCYYEQLLLESKLRSLPRVIESVISPVATISTIIFIFSFTITSRP